MIEKVKDSHLIRWVLGRGFYSQPESAFLRVNEGQSISECFPDVPAPWKLLGNDSRGILRAMKVLLIAGFFPPFAPVAATRSVKFAKYLLEQGHDVRVLAPRNSKFPPLLKCEISEDRVIYTDFTDRSALPGKLMARLKRDKAGGDTPPPGQKSDSVAAVSSPPKPGGSKAGLGKIYRRIVNVPDPTSGWFRHAVKEGKALIDSWKPDLLYVSTPPHTGLLVADRLSRDTGVPWVAEYRDLWVRHPYYDAPKWRRPYERWLEWRALSSVSGIVTVTQTWRELMARVTGKPTILSMNGFDPDDFAAPVAADQPGEPLSILYAGSLYQEKRDPSPLFEALAGMGSAARDFRVHFYTAETGYLSELVSALGLEDVVILHEPVPREDIARLEQDSDVLLLLRWDHPSERSVIAGKLFEYIGAGRPILSLGATDGEAADIIREHQLGEVTNDPGRIAEILGHWLARKRDGVRLEPDGIESRPLFERSRQFELVEEFLTRLL